MNTDSIYWLFSSSAQSIAGLIGFLMAGVTLAFSMMDRLADEDDTMREVIQALKKRHHRELAALAITTGLAIIASLLVLYCNPLTSILRSPLIVFAAILDFSVVCGAIYFVVLVASPSRYTRAAQSEYQLSVKPFQKSEKVEPDHVFFREFVGLEKDVRGFFKDNNLFIPPRFEGRSALPFSPIIQALYQNEKISSQLRDKLLAVTKTRNLLFHGRIEEVDEKVVNDLRETRQAWNNETAQRS